MREQKVALVTGVSSGIGREIATLLSDRGFRVFGTIRKVSDANERFGTPIKLDVRDEDAVRACLRTVLDQTGRVDALVNNAGATLVGSLEETSIEEAKELFETNFFGVLRMTQAVLPFMREQGYGRIVNIGSVLSFLPAPYQGIYAASKHALEGYSESLDHEVRQFGIRVSVIEPGYMRTNINQNSRLAGQLLAAYSGGRNSVLNILRESIAKGEDPARVASVTWEAITSRDPKLRYTAGRQAKLLNLLNRIAPAKVMDNGLRKQFGLSDGNPVKA